MANYEVDPDLLKPFVPGGTELDDWNGKTFVSLVGFLFLDTRLRGVSIPFHRNFEEVNLRFYVRCKEGGEWKRGVVFIKEIVPRRAIATVARYLYGEPYVRLPMRHERQWGENGLRVGYSWKFRSEWNFLEVDADPEAREMPSGSEEEFIAEHYWGYTARGGKQTTTYQVEHPSWRVHPVREHRISFDAQGLYGARFADLSERKADSVFLAEGSEIIVREGRPLRSG